MRILITGGAGFIGSHLAHAYAEDGHEVFIFDRNLMEKASGDLAKHSTIMFYEGDILQKDSVCDLLQTFQFDLVSHHAAQGNVRGNPTALAAAAWDNTRGTINVVQAAIQTNVPRFIFASSGTAVYGQPLILPANEETPLRPLSPYGLSKVIGEAVTKELLKQKHSITQLCILRYANVYGPGQRAKPGAGVIPAFIQRMMVGQKVVITGDGKQERDFIYIDDIITANRLVLQKDAFGTVYNVGSGIGSSIAEVYSVVALAFRERATSVEIGQIPLQDIEVNKIILDITSINADLQWTPRYDLKRGIIQTVRAKGIV